MIKKRRIGPGRFALTDLITQLETAFSCQLTACTVAWSDETEDDTEVLCGDIEPGDVTWSAAVSGSMFQDRDINGLVQWTWENKGKKFGFVFVANDADGTQVTGQLTVKPLDFGGEVKVSAASDFEWACVGEPKIEAFTAPEPEPAP